MSQSAEGNRVLSKADVLKVAAHEKKLFYSETCLAIVIQLHHGGSPCLWMIRVKIHQFRTNLDVALSNGGVAWKYSVVS
jgi:hypothetical protein